MKSKINNNQWEMDILLPRLLALNGLPFVWTTFGLDFLKSSKISQTKQMYCYNSRWQKVFTEFGRVAAKTTNNYGGNYYFLPCNHIVPEGSYTRPRKQGHKPVTITDPNNNWEPVHNIYVWIGNKNFSHCKYQNRNQS